MAISNEIEKLERRWQQTSGLVFAPLAEAYRKAGLHQRALEVLDQGLALHPDYGPALIVRGRCHLDSGSLPEAETAFDQALTRDPMDPIAIRGIADVFARTGRVSAAVERLQLLVDMDPRNVEARGALERLLQLVTPPTAVSEPAPAPAEPVFTATAAPAPAPEPAPTLQAEAASTPPEATPVPAIPLEEIPLEPISLPPAEPAPLLIEPTSLAPVEPPPATPSDDDFRVVSFAVEPLEVPAELREPPAAKPEPEPEVDRFAPISWTPAPVEELQPSEPAEPPADRQDNAVTFTPALVEPASAAEARSPESDSVEAAPEPAVAEETPAAPVTAESAATEPMVPVMDDGSDSAREEAGFAPAVQPEPEPVGWTPPVEAEAIAEPVADEYASAMPLPVEQEPAVIASSPVTEQFAEPVFEREPAGSVEPVGAEAEEPLIDSEEHQADEPPALIVTESMAELFLKQGHRELALAVYRQLAARGALSERLQTEMARVEDELSSRASAAVQGKAYAARATGGKSVEDFLQGVLQAQPPAPASSVLPPAIEPAAGEPTRPTSDTLPLSAVFGDEPVVPPRPQPAPTQSEPSFDEFFGAAPSPEPTPAGGAERSPESEDLRQFNEWLKGLKR